MWPQKQSGFVICAFILSLYCHRASPQSDWTDEREYDIISDLQLDGFTVANKTLFSKQYGISPRLSPSASGGRAQAQDTQIEDDILLPAEQEARRYRRQSQQQDVFVYSGDDPCNNSTLCKATGQQCQFAGDNQDGFTCVCRVDYETQHNNSCTVVPEVKKLYLTATLTYAYTSSLGNSSSGDYLMMSADTEQALAPEFNTLSGYKTLKVLQFRQTGVRTQLVFSLYFTTEVLASMIVDVAGTVLQKEAAGVTVPIAGSLYMVTGLFGVFRTLTSTSQTLTDAVDWCKDQKLHRCNTDRFCKDGGFDPRYTCQCKQDTQEIDGDCVKQNEIQYDLMAYASHSIMQRSDDETQRVAVPSGIPVGTDLQYNLWIGVNGFISFGQDHTGLDFQLQRYKMMVCPYFSDINTLRGNGDIYYKLYSSRTGNEYLFSRADSMIQEFAQLNSFNTKLLVVVTWSNVSHYYSTNPLTQIATFQTVLISDGRKSYAVVTYKRGSMNWEYRPSIPLIIGLSRGQRYPVKQRMYTNTPQAFRGLENIPGDTGRRGMYLYELGEAYSADLECDDWYQSELSSIGRLWQAFSRMPDCPCTTSGMSSSWEFSYNPQHPGLTCYRLSRSASWRHWPHNKVGPHNT